MLVYARSPDSMFFVKDEKCHFRIYGRNLCMPPTDIPFEVYRSSISDLEDASYRKEYLQKLFSKSFPEVAFTYSGLKWLTEKTLDEIGPLMLSFFDHEWSKKQKIDEIKTAVRLTNYIGDRNAIY